MGILAEEELTEAQKKEIDARLPPWHKCLMEIVAQAKKIENEKEKRELRG